MTFRARVSIFVLLLVSTSAFAAPPKTSPVRYAVQFPGAANHYAEVDATFPTEGKKELELFLPVWTPGSYLVREYSRHIDQIAAYTDGGTPLAIEKTIKNRWKVHAGGAHSVRVHYRVYGREINIRSNWIESDFALLNGGATFLSVVGRLDRPLEVSLQMPAGWKGAYTSLARDANGTFAAPNYDTLVDSPIVAGSPQVDSFPIDGVTHYVVTVGGEGVWDNAKIAAHLTKVVQAERDFWGELPSDRPYYFLNLLTGSRGGLEHKNSTVLMADRFLSRTNAGVNSWLSLASHEFFHAWNGKRLRPEALGPFDYEHEVYTRSLWIVEGITSYYQHVLLHRAGVTSRADLINAMSGQMTAVQGQPGRFVQSIGDASFDTWIRAYRPDENTSNTTISYYGSGALAAFLLDAEIRRVSSGQRSLDDVMRHAYARYSGEAGYTEEQFRALASDVAGADLSGWFKRVIDGTGDFDYQPMLDWYGLAFEAAPPPAHDAEPPKAWLGADTKVDGGRLVVSFVKNGTPAAAAGLSADDEILAIDDYRVKPDQWAARLGAYHSGEKATLLVARLDHLLRLNVTFGEEPANRWKLIIRKDATPEQKAHLEAWGGPEKTEKAK